METFAQHRQHVVKQLLKHASLSVSLRIEKGIIAFMKSKCTKCKVKNQYLWSNVWVRRHYLRKARSVIYNMPSIVTNKPVDLEWEQVAFMKPTETNPENWKEIIEKHEARDRISKVMFDDEAVNGLLRCPHEDCGSYRTKYVELQTRSADEPMTVYAICLECNRNWSQ